MHKTKKGVNKMCRTYKVKRPPKEVKAWFDRNFPDCEYKFYWYRGYDQEKVYGCEVYHNNEYWHNATQADLEWFKNSNKEAQQ